MGKRKATRSEIIERNRKIVKDYEDGLSFEQLSEKYGLCVRTCYRALDEEQQAQRIAEEQDHANLVDKIVAEYQKNTAARSTVAVTVRHDIKFGEHGSENPRQGSPLRERWEELAHEFSRMMNVYNL